MITLSNEDCRQWIYDNVTSSTNRQSMSCDLFFGRTNTAHPFLSPHAPHVHVRVISVRVQPGLKCLLLFAHKNETVHSECAMCAHRKGRNSYFANRRQIETSFPNGINDIILCTRGIKNKDTNCFSVSKVNPL